jgi:two-component system nitrate/nitrite sensor histidine kinase NarX
VGVAHAERDYFTAHHADLALTVANQAAITLVNAELYERAQTLAALHERQRLAQDLHDAVNQSLFSAGLIAEVLPRLWERDAGEGRRSLEDLRRLTRGALAELRALLAELRPSILTDTDLGDLLRQLGSAFTGRTNIPVAVTVGGQGILPTGVQVAFYRVCQEGLSNIAKHTEASQVAIDLLYDPGAVELRLSDDGCGFDPAHISPGRSGLSMMRERAQAVGAVLSIASQPGQGTELTIRWTKGPEQEAL